MLVSESGELTNVFQDVFGEYSASVQAIGGVLIGCLFTTVALSTGLLIVSSPVRKVVRHKATDM